MSSPLRALLEGRLEDLAARTDLAAVEVAILDSGIDATHPELAGRVVAAVQVELVEQRPVIRELPTNTNADAFGHGTAVASIIARLAPNARLVDIRVLGPVNAGAGIALLAGLDWALDRRCPVVNMSLAAKAEFAPRLATACERAYRQRQVIVAAKRNIPLVDLGFPAELSASISVEAITSDRPYALRFLSDPPIEFAASGDQISVAAPGGGRTTKTGASFATPHVAAFCALILGAYPTLRPFEVKAVLRAWAEEG